MLELWYEAATRMSTITRPSISGPTPSRKSPTSTESDPKPVDPGTRRSADAARTVRPRSSPPWSTPFLEHHRNHWRGAHRPFRHIPRASGAQGEGLGRIIRVRAEHFGRHPLESRAKIGMAVHRSAAPGPRPDGCRHRGWRRDAPNRHTPHPGGFAGSMPPESPSGRCKAAGREAVEIRFDELLHSGRPNDHRYVEVPATPGPCHAQSHSHHRRVPQSADGRTNPGSQRPACAPPVRWQTSPTEKTARKEPFGDRARVPSRASGQQPGWPGSVEIHCLEDARAGRWTSG
jgi:hypothetical protein